MRARTTTSIGKKVTTALLALTMALGLALGLAPGVALADDVFQKSADNTSLGTGGIAVAQDGKWVAGGGSYVYYGKYDGAHTRYRVLANGTTGFTGEGEPTMLLDCDAVLATTAYGTTRAWGTSSVKVWATGDAFLTKEGNFTAPEKAAIAQSATSRAGELEPDDATTLGKDFRLNGEQAFVLSAGEAKEYYADNNARKKNGGDGVWWLRTAGSDPNDTCAAIVYDGGYVYSFGYPVRSAYIGVSPAFNIDLKSVIFSSLISGVAGQSGAEYKLTIKDAGLGASGTAALDGTKATVATVTYATTGDAATQASYLVTDKAWDDGWPADAQALAYGRLGAAGKGEGSFELPEGRAADGWGSDYHVYLLAEAVNGDESTDCASAPFEVSKPSLKPTPAPEPGPTPEPTPTPTPTSEPTPSATVAKAAKPKTVAYPSKGEVAVSWKAAKGAKTYQLQWRKAGAKKWSTASVKGRSKKVTGLKKGVAYEFRVLGVSGKVSGKWSAASPCWLKGAAKVKAVAGSAKGTVKATWKADKAATGGFKVFVYAKRGGKAVKTKVVKAGATSATVKGLKSGKTYYVRVRPYRTQGGSTYHGAISGYRAAKAK